MAAPRDKGTSAWNRLVDELKQLEKASGSKAALARWEKVIAANTLQGEKREFSLRERTRLAVKIRQRELRENARKLSEQRKSEAP
jgi:hypothetical protein